jgi:hypothetical protein
MGQADGRRFAPLRLSVVSLHMVQHELTDSLASIRADALVACVAQSNGHVSGVR